LCNECSKKEEGEGKGEEKKEENKKEKKIIIRGKKNQVGRGEAWRRVTMVGM
jgi:hypothetical protein